jgi:hypothetical protein
VNKGKYERYGYWKEEKISIRENGRWKGKIFADMKIKERSMHH